MLTSLLTTTNQQSAVDALRTEQGQLQFGAIRRMLEDFGVANSIFGDLMAGMGIDTLRQTLQ